MTDFAVGPIEVTLKFGGETVAFVADSVEFDNHIVGQTIVLRVGAAR